MAAMQPSDTHPNCNDRSVVVLKTSDVRMRGNDVFMPMTIKIFEIKKARKGAIQKGRNYHRDVRRRRNRKAVGDISISSKSEVILSYHNNTLE